MSDFTEKAAAIIGEIINRDQLDEGVEMAVIPKEELERLYDDQHMLNCLEAAGVDNWSGYDYAMEMYNEEDDE